ncbi:VUT family protein [Amycolatopsis acidiphila]|uniref:VUT family protein n=1 Tax=Amycolatopsis acidiphila TaxID=715473 RepID=UPI001C98CE96|nr:VUT family protein [Amycolatopsis acidiphila]UIJ59161.1 VUT family protein [Amycolatopsis acidiphila]
MPVFGLQIPAGAFFAGLVFTVRNLLQDAAGSRTALIAVVAGAALSGLVASPHVALASAAAFATSETADFAVYTRLRRRRPVVAMALSDTVGLLLDSLVFLSLAFGSLSLFGGQVAGKAVTTVVAVSVLTCARAGRRAVTT